MADIDPGALAEKLPAVALKRYRCFWSEHRHRKSGCDIMQCLPSERRKRKTDSLNGINKIIRLMRQIFGAYTSIHHRLACKVCMMLHQFVYVFKSGLRCFVSMCVHTKRNVLMVACMCLPHGVERVRYTTMSARRQFGGITSWIIYLVVSLLPVYIL